MNSIDEVVLKKSEQLWNYLRLQQKLENSDCILVFGGHDPSVAIHAAELYREKWAKKVIVSGGVVHPAHYYGLTEPLIEAEALKIILKKEGVIESDILLECKAKNTSENFWFTNDLIERENLNFQTFILVQKPYTERRTYLTGLNRWPNKKIIISSINQSFKEYINGGIEIKKIIDMMVGEIYRILEYPKLGYFERQIIPDDILEAYNYLVACGYDSRITKK